LLITVLLSTLLAGLAMPLGAFIACYEKFQSQWLEEEFRHGIIAFGGGALLSAVALVLVPEGLEHLQPMSAASYFVAGGISFMLLDIYFSRLNTPASQLMAMLSDFIPESIALGAAFATGKDSAMLLAVLIALQNLPEGFNAFRELRDNTHYSSKRIIIAFSIMALLGPIAGLSGNLWLSNFPGIISAIMLFACWRLYNYQRFCHFYY